MPKLLLTWLYQYKDGLIKHGMWSNPGEEKDLANKAWANHRDDIVFAGIYSKDVLSRDKKILAECRGCDFRNFQWIATTPVIVGSDGKFKGSNIVRIDGIKLLTRYETIEVMIDGTIKRLPPSDENINFKIYGR